MDKRPIPYVDSESSGMLTYYFSRSPMVEEAVRYSEIFQAECMYKTMKKMGVREAVVLGHSYGGFVAYRMAHLYPRFVKRLVILSSGIMMNPHSNDALLRKSGATRIHDLLVPTTLPIFIKSLQLVLNDYLPTWLPSFLYKDMLEVHLFHTPLHESYQYNAILMLMCKFGLIIKLAYIFAILVSLTKCKLNFYCATLYPATFLFFVIHFIQFDD